ncbi:transketolase family protein [Candidatus Peregrinibacteria bacterium]|nr:MAG: transketolase family protein [Candidatus Peregrinibacteria bacterium]
MSIATRVAFGETLLELGYERDDIVVIDADLRESTKTGKFEKVFPNRAFNIGISEQDLVATAAGFAIAGKKPFACSFATFLTGRAYDQIRTAVAISEKPVVLVGSHAGILTGEDGATHQSLEDIGLMRALPGVIVLHPADAEETKAMVRFAAESSHPVYLRLGRIGVPTVFESGTKFEIGNVQTLTEGRDITLFATGPLVASALIATKILEDEISVRVVNVSCLSPLDIKGVLQALGKVSKVMTAEDHSIYNGLGSAIAEVMAENAIGMPLFRHGMRRFGESGTSLDLYEKYKFDGEGVAEVIREFWKK